MKRFAGRFAESPGAVAGLVILALIILAAITAPVLFPTDPMAPVGKPLLPPGSGFAFGTDMLGRDVLVGIFYGARISLLIGILSTV
ncbi:MAG TPA: ABC transporter permease, partial [Pararhizobium sp.]|nr:ABC transporter permease [Pararhizobium sp.]